MPSSSSQQPHSSSSPVRCLNLHQAISSHCPSHHLSISHHRSSPESHRPLAGKSEPPAGVHSKLGTAINGRPKLFPLLTPIVRPPSRCPSTIPPPHVAAAAVSDHRKPTSCAATSPACCPSLPPIVFHRLLHFRCQSDAAWPATTVTPSTFTRPSPPQPTADQPNASPMVVVRPCPCRSSSSCRPPKAHVVAAPLACHDRHLRRHPWPKFTRCHAEVTSSQQQADPHLCSPLPPTVLHRLHLLRRQSASLCLHGTHTPC